MAFLILSLGLVLCVEGLVLALAPLRLEEALRYIATLTPATRRTIGLCALGAGVLLVWIARGYVAL